MKAKTFLIIIGLFCITNASGERFPMPAPGNDIVGHVFAVKVLRGDSVTTIRQRYDISLDGLVAANPDINFYRLRVGQKIVIPDEFILPKFRRGIVINIPELRLYYFTPDGRYVYTFPVGLGRELWRTPTAIARVISKKEDPVWHPPESIREYTLEKRGDLLPYAVLPGPDNPLGKYALFLSKTGYMIHGTNAPDSVGTFISSGCMRLLKEPIETLYQEVEVGTPVYIVHFPNKAGWFGDTLYLESHHPVTGYDPTDSDLNTMSASNAIYNTINLQPAYVNWNLVKDTVENHEGIPTPIGQRHELIP